LTLGQLSVFFFFFFLVPPSAGDALDFGAGLLDVDVAGFDVGAAVDTAVGATTGFDDGTGGALADALVEGAALADAEALTDGAVDVSDALGAIVGDGVSSS
jgi:hypothetical protein